MGSGGDVQRGGGWSKCARKRHGGGRHWGSSESLAWGGRNWQQTLSGTVRCQHGGNERRRGNILWSGQRRRGSARQEQSSRVRLRCGLEPHATCTGHRCPHSSATYCLDPGKASRGLRAAPATRGRTWRSASKWAHPTKHAARQGCPHAGWASQPDQRARTGERTPWMLLVPGRAGEGRSWRPSRTGGEPVSR